jgi:hypothetical protein
MVVIGFPSDEASETFTAAVYKVEPQVIRKRAMPVGAFSIT